MEDLQQDEYSLSGVTFGDKNQLRVVGIFGRIGHNKYYSLVCNICSEDTELFGEGIFKSTRNSLSKGCMPCGCSRTRWTNEQFYVLCGRKATLLGYSFLGFVGEWAAQYTKLSLKCASHGVWDTGSISTLLNGGNGCPICATHARIKANTLPAEEKVKSFLVSGNFHPDTKFWKSDRVGNDGVACYWYMSCPECGEIGESQSSNLQNGCMPCACSTHRQKECYINWIVDGGNYLAIKFGIARNSKQRVKQQGTRSAYTITQYQVYTFPSVASCKAAERECKQTLQCGVLTKEEVPDGYTETTSPLNIEKIISIYEKHGGILQPKE